MRTLFLILATTLLLGLAFAMPVEAHSNYSRIWVSIGDVSFSAGAPYHRHQHYPLHVVHGNYGPRYFYYAPPPPPPPQHHRKRRNHVYGYGPAPVVYYDYSYQQRPAPRPLRPGYHRHRPGY